MPAQFTTDPGTKPLPLTVSVNAGPPAFTEAGLVPVIVGPAGELMVKGKEAEFTYGSPIRIEAEAALTRSTDGTTAVRVVELTKVVGSRAGGADEPT